MTYRRRRRFFFSAFVTPGIALAPGTSAHAAGELANRGPRDTYAVSRPRGLQPERTLQSALPRDAAAAGRLARPRYRYVRPTATLPTATGTPTGHTDKLQICLQLLRISFALYSETADMRADYALYWWRAQTTKFIVRPKEWLIEYADRERKRTFPGGARSSR